MNKTIKKTMLCMAGSLLLQSAGMDNVSAAGWREERMAHMSIEEKVAQMFMITPEVLTGYGQVTAAGDATREAIDRIPVGGLIYFAENLYAEDQIKEMLENVNDYSMERVGVPMLLALDEEGGRVSRISGRGVADVPVIGSMASVGSSMDPSDAYDVGAVIGSYLHRMHFNVNFAPVADVNSNPNNPVIGDRSFGSDPNITADMVFAYVKGIEQQHVSATLKHFPGHGDTGQDSHTGSAYVNKTMDELWRCELPPFQAGIDAGADLIMVGHISLPQILGDDTPATLSHYLLTDVLRKQMGFSGIIITDAMNMAAVSNYYSSGEAAVRAIEAGADIVLMPVDFQAAYNGVLSAVHDGRIAEERIDASVRRILSLKEHILYTDDRIEENGSSGIAEGFDDGLIADYDHGEPDHSSVPPIGSTEVIDGQRRVIMYIRENETYREIACYEVE